MKFFKKAKADMGTILVVLIAILVANQLGFLPGAAQSAGGGVDGGAAPITLQIEGGCSVEDTTLTVTAIDTWSASTFAGGNHLYRRGTGSWTGVNDEASITASPGEVLQFMTGNSSAIWLNDLMDYTVPCKGADTVTFIGYRNGSTTIRVFSEDNGNLIAAAEEETLTSGDVVDLDGTFQTQFERAPYKNGACLVMEYDIGLYDDVKVSFDGVTDKISTPDFYNVHETNRSTKTYAMPSSLSNVKLDMIVHLDVDDTNDPTGDAGDINMTWYPNEYRLNPDNNNVDLFMCGEDQDGNRVANPVTGYDYQTLFVD